VIRAGALRVRFNDRTVLDFPALEIRPTERLGIRGPNGSGKSTLLRVLAGLLAPDAGMIAGLPPRGRTVLVHQRPYFFRGTAADNVAYALRLHRRPAAEAMGWLERVGAGHLARRHAKVLSEGERRRVALARALAVRPELLLLDETLAPLDEEGRETVLGVLGEWEGAWLLAAPDLEAVPVERILELNPRGGGG